MYPHAVTGMLAARRRNVVRRNMVILPAYSLLLGFAALLALHDTRRTRRPAGRQGLWRQRPTGRAAAVPEDVPPWFEGIAFSAIVIGALAPAAIMSIAAANLFTRNIYNEYLKPDATPAQGRPDRLAHRQAGRPAVRARLEQDVLH
jgi:SSS family solute:Na+ symporter